MIGYWLGDGTSQLSAITTMDREIIDYFEKKSIDLNLNVKEYTKRDNKASTFVYSSKNKGLKNKLYDNLFHQTLKKLDLLNNKHIPDIYKINSKDNRLKILAGIIDSDGHYQKNSNQYEITLKSEKLIDDILYIARSLGFSCTKRIVSKSCKDFTGNYFNIIIYGEGIEEIPVLLERKKAIERNKVKNSSYYGFKIEKVKDDYFYGFELDGNHRYLMGDFTVTHNSNGKSKILELFVQCLGMYSIKFPITMLTGKRAASNACTPEIVQSKGKRFGYFEEPSENERINAGLLKEFTGGDKIKARGLHKEPIEFKPQFKLALLCNEMPEVPPNDSGTWRRMEVIEFKSRFCENPKESHEFPIDKYLSEKLKNWKELFMALLLDVYYKKYQKEGIKVPLEIIKFTLEYQKQCDLYTDFISENLEDTKDSVDVIDITSLYDEFKTWYEDTFSNHKYPSKIEFKKYLKKRYTTKRISTNEVKGFKFKFKYEKPNLEPHLMQGY
jgi:P4 family phage/plasmid primase-like protien